MKNENLLAAAVVAGVALYFYKDIKSAFAGQPWTKSQTEQALSSAGLAVTQETTGTFAQIPGGVMKITSGFKPNLAQRLLIGVDRVVPGTWLTRLALT